MDEIKTQYPKIFERLGDEGVKKAYDAAIGMAFDKLKGERKEPRRESE